MIDFCLSWLSPHICKGCRAVGKALCGSCKKYILDQSGRECITCQREIDWQTFAWQGNLCAKCANDSPFKRVFVVGERKTTLRELVDDYKFASERDSAQPIADLILSILPEKLPDDLIIMPLTTIPKHIRQRGLDHTKLIVRNLARLRKMTAVYNVLLRNDNIAQHSADAKTRARQAAKTFAINPRTKIPKKILLIDDIYTTGATATAAAKLLRKHGAKEIWLGIVARQIGNK
ncbi:MAG: hypothetical protein LBM09_02465 [Candidatus Nomurabacteria bacterium]|jgi:ComF family protein|nr:hypothetical protein [Candidatus Nomurabacteria bacterium]